MPKPFRVSIQAMRSFIKLSAKAIVVHNNHGGPEADRSCPVQDERNRGWEKSAFDYKDIMRIVKKFDVRPQVRRGPDEERAFFAGRMRGDPFRHCTLPA